MPPRHSILVVDDEENIRSSLSGLLRDHGYDVVTAGSGTECLQILSSQHINLVILDIVMPEMSGIEVLQKIKEKYKDTEVLMISGYADKEKAIAAFRLDAYDLIEKPFESREMLNTVAHCLNQLDLRKDVGRKNRELRESEERYHAIFNGARDGIVLINRKTCRINDCNPEFERQTGRKLDQLKKVRIWDLSPKKKAETAKKEFLEIKENETGGFAELEFQKPDGNIASVELISKVIKIRDRQFIQSITRDVTEREYAEEALERLRHQNELILNSAGEGILGLDLQGNHTFVNPSAARMLGYETEELIGQHSHTTWHHSKADGTLYPEDDCPIYATYKDGAVHYNVKEEVFWRKDGTSFPVSYTSTPIIENGNIVGAVLTFRDITEQKKMEDALRKSEERYRGMVSAVTAYTYSVEVCGGQSVSTSHSIGCLPITGYNPEDYESNPSLWFSMIHLDDRTLVKNSIKEILAGHRVPAIEHRLIRRDGSIIWVRNTMVPYYDVEGWLIRYDGLIEDITERRQTEEALRESEEKYRTIIENSNDLIWTLNKQGNFTYFNRKAEEVSGYKLEEWLGKSFEPLIPPDDLPGTRTIFLDTLGGKSRHFEVNVYRKDGSLFVLSVNTAPIFESGEAVGTVSLGRDITEQKSTEVALRTYGYEWRATLDAVKDAIVLLDMGGRILRCNNAMANLLGKSFSEIIGSPCWELMDSALESIKGCFRHMKETKSRETMILPRGDQWVNVTVDPMLDETDNLIGGVCIISDITDRKQAEEILIQRQQALQSVYKMATTPTLSSSFEAVCDQVVLNLAQLLRVPHVAVQRIEGDQISIISRITDGKFIHNEMISPRSFPCAFVYGKKESCQIKGFLQQLFPENKFISQYDFRTHIGVPIKNSGGEVVGFFCIMGYEERVFSDDEIQLIEIFARYVAHEIERDVMETQLRQLDRMKVLGQLAGGVAHEVRNPLNAIMANTEVLFQDIGDNPEYKPFLGHIRTQVDRLSRLMGDLLDLGKPLQQSKLLVESLRAILSAAIDLWKQTTSPQKHKVRLVLPSECGNPDVIADSQKLQQVFLNLLENAAHHSPEDSEIQLVILNSEEKTIQVHVIDRGTGIPLKNLPMVFEPFFSTRKKGTGLGLSIVKHIIEAHGGNVTIWNNDPPPGCKVEISLPAIQESKP